MLLFKNRVLSTDPVSRVHFWSTTDIYFLFGRLAVAELRRTLDARLQYHCKQIPLKEKINLTSNNYNNKLN